ncbi:MAG: hypothetical protein ABR508_03575 [Candidatus Baltobacteraceae bacterium]
MNIFRKWLRVERPAGVAPYAARAVELPVPAHEVLTLCESAVRDVLGGTIAQSEPQNGFLEARFGLVDSERLTITVEAAGPQLTRVRVQARRGVCTQTPGGSRYADALCAYLMKSSPK